MLAHTALALICWMATAVLSADTNTPKIHKPNDQLLARQFKPDQVMNSTWPVSMWFDANPTYWDVIQRKVFDCWLAATTISVVAAQPSWLKNIIYTEDGQSMADMKDPFVNKAIIQLWDMNSNLRHNFSVTAALQSSTEDRPGERWWNSAIMQALMTMGQLTGVPGVHDSTFSETGGDPGAALFALTGHSAVSKERGYYGWPDKIDEERMFTEMRTAYYNRSPMVITTYQGDVDDTGLMQDSVLYSYHAYGFMWPKKYKNGTMTAMLRNPWGKSTEVSIRELIQNMSWMYHLHEFAALNWTAVNNGEYPFWGYNKKQFIWNYNDPILPVESEMPAVQDITVTLSDRVTTYAQASAKYTMSYIPTSESTTEIASTTGPTAIAQPTATGQVGQDGQPGVAQPIGQGGQQGQQGPTIGGGGGGDLTEITDDAGQGGAGGAPQMQNMNAVNGNQTGQQVSPALGSSSQLASAHVTPIPPLSTNQAQQPTPSTGQWPNPPIQTSGTDGGNGQGMNPQSGLIALEEPAAGDTPGSETAQLADVHAGTRTGIVEAASDPVKEDSGGFIKGGGLIALERPPDAPTPAVVPVRQGNSPVDRPVQDDTNPLRHGSGNEQNEGTVRSPQPAQKAERQDDTDGSGSLGGQATTTVPEALVYVTERPIVTEHAAGQAKIGVAAKRRSRR